MHQSDVFLNLHEGGGFYRHTWEGPNHNPMKYGQCLIADADVYIVEETGKVINLKQIAEAVIEQINKKITIAEHTYRFNNHDTLSRSTRHAEQRKSASFYGLTRANIPSYGVEVSSALSTETLKKEYMILVLNEFMNYFDIQKNVPPLHEPTPMLNYLLIVVNDEKRFVEPNDVINLAENSTLNVVGISTNYPRGNYVDVLGHGNRNDINKTFTIARITDILVYKDNQTIAKIPIRVSGETIVAFEGFRVHILDENVYRNVFAGDTLFVTEGAEFEIIGPLNPNPSVSITVAGATVRRVSDRQIIDTGTGLSQRFAINNDRNLYEIIINENNRKIANAYLKIRSIEASGLHITHNGKRIVMAPGETLYTDYNDTIFIHDVDLNGVSSDKVRVNFAGYILNPLREAEDRGGNIYLNSKGLIPRFAVNEARNLYEIHVLYNRARYATYSVYIRQ
jgi:hypothetical protein